MFSSRKKIAIDGSLYQKLEAKAEKDGYSSTDEFIRHVLSNAVKDDEAQSDREQIDKQLRGLGYLE